MSFVFISTEYLQTDFFKIDISASVSISKCKLCLELGDGIEIKSEKSLFIRRILCSTGSRYEKMIHRVGCLYFAHCLLTFPAVVELQT